MFPELYLLRHGETEWNRESRHQGWLDSALTRRGRAQAEAMGRALAAELGARRALAAWVSPQGRARQTAALALTPLGLEARADGRLAEVGMGGWQGLTTAELYARFPGAEAARAADPWGFYFAAPGGESRAEVEARLAGFLADLTGPAIVVGHGVALRVLRGLWLGLDPAATWALPGGQGVIWHLKDGAHRVIDPGPVADFLRPDA